MRKYLILWTGFLLVLPTLFYALDIDESSSRMASLSGTALAGTNTLKVRDAYGMTGQTISIYVDVKNEDAFCNFQFDVVLPACLAMQTATIALTPRSQDQTLNWNLISGNTYRFVALSFTKTAFKGNSGAILRFDCQVSGSAASYSMMPQSITLMNASYQNILTSSSNGIFTIFTQRAKVKIKAWLEGWYNSGTMRTDLRAADELPFTSPYPEAVRNATGWPTDLADWILLELRSSTMGDPIFLQSYLHKSTGYLCEMDGTTIDLLLNVPPGSYYLILRHRNHAAVMSAATVALSSVSTQFYDFTSALSKYYGQTGRLVASGVYAIPCGELNGDKFITTLDYVSWYHKARTSPAPGYHLEDLNGDRSVNDADFTLWQTCAREGMRSEVP